MPAVLPTARGVLDVDWGQPLAREHPLAAGLILCLLGVPHRLRVRDSVIVHGGWSDLSLRRQPGTFQDLNASGGGPLVWAPSLPPGVGAVRFGGGASPTRYRLLTMQPTLHGAQAATLAVVLRPASLVTSGSRYLASWPNALTANGFDLRQTNAQVQADLVTAGADSGAVLSASLPDASRFHRVILTYRGGTGRLVLNGHLASTHAFGGTTLLHGTGQGFLAHFSTSTGSFSWDGDIACAMLWRDRGLSVAEAQQLDAELRDGFPSLLRRLPRWWAVLRAAITPPSAALTAPALLAPTNGATDVGLTPLLTWAAVQDAITYQVQLADNAGFTAPLLLDVSGLPDPMHGVTTPLTAGTQYWWRARAANAGGDGPWASAFTFTTGVGAPLTGIGLGFQVRGGLAREALTDAPGWPAAAPAALTHLLPLLSEDLQEVQTLAPGTRRGDASTRRASGPHVLRLHAREVRGTVRLRAQYGGQTLVWALALGYMARRLDGTLLPEALGGGVYRHRYEVAALLGARPWDAALDGFEAGELAAGQRLIRRATAAVAKGVNVWEARSVMVDTLTLEAAPGQTATLTLGLRGYAIEHRSTVNTPERLSLLDLRWDVRSAARSVFFDDLTLRLAPVSTLDPLTSAADLQPAGVTLTVQNRLRSPQRRTVAPYPGEFERGGPAEVSGQIRLPRFTTTAELDRFAVQDDLMLLCNFVGPAVGVSGLRLQCWLPRLRLTAVDVPTTGPAAHAPTLAWTAMQPVAVPAGFPATVTTSPLVVELWTQDAQHPLLDA